MPRGCSDDSFSWGKHNTDPLKNKHLFVVHAELNAILNRGNTSIDMCSIYTTRMPCSGCAKAIIQANIKEVIYLEDKHPESIDTKAALLMFESAGVKLRQMIWTAQITL